MELDHVVLWVEDPIRSVEFFEKVVGLTPVRVEEFQTKQVLFPSVRIAEGCLIDLIPLSAAPMINAIPGAAGTAGHKTNHLCLAMSKAELEALAVRLEAAGRKPGRNMQNQFGARGFAARAYYFTDPDGNVLEARHYES